MDLRATLYEWAAVHRLDTPAVHRLETLAGLGRPPAALQRRLGLGLGALAAALGGCGLVFWVAANWADWGRVGRFALLQGAVAVMGAGALLRSALRVPLSLLVLLATGGLLAYFGQTYQTGADPWQLFALWALLCLPLGLAARSDVVWVPWVLVAFTGVALWVAAQTGHGWRARPADLSAHLAGWALAVAIGGALAVPLRGATGAGAWALRTAFTLVVVLVTSTAMVALFASTWGPAWGWGLLVLGAAAGVFAVTRAFDVFVLSAVALGLDTLLVAGAARLLFDSGGHGSGVGSLLLLGLVGAAVLAGSVSAVLRLARRHGEESAR